MADIIYVNLTECNPEYGGGFTDGALKLITEQLHPGKFQNACVINLKGVHADVLKVILSHSKKLDPNDIDFRYMSIVLYSTLSTYIKNYVSKNSKDDVIGILLDKHPILNSELRRMLIGDGNFVVVELESFN